MALFGQDDPQPVEIRGNPLQCLVCNGKLFRRRQAQLNTAVATFFKFDWANASADCVVCSNCGYIHWFMPES
jgi:uncharacterized protein with PIN domain